jgi:RHS repeat-associated protein
MNAKIVYRLITNIAEAKMKKLFRRSVSNNLVLALMEINKRSQKFLAFLLLIGIFVGLLPQAPITYAVSEIPQTEERSEVPTQDKLPDYPTTIEAKANFDDVELLGEIESFRTQTSKTFQRVDGTYVLAMYGDVIHFQQDGKWKDIDNSFEYESKSDTYTNRANGFHIKFPKSINANEQIKMTIDQYAVNWSIQGVSLSSIQFATAKRNSEDMRELSSITQEVLYPSVIPGVDVQYIVSGSKVKENIILSNYIKDFSLSFDYEISNLQFLVQEDQYIFVNDKGETIFSLIDLYAMDAAGEVTFDVKANITVVDKSRFVLALSVDDAWLKNAEYPVTIDPTISSPSDITIEDTYVQANSSLNYSGSSSLLFNDGTSYSLNPGRIAYLDFTVPNYLKDYHITYANLTVSKASGSSTVLLRELTSKANLNIVTWANRPSAASQIVDYAVFNSSTSKYTFDITSSVQKWNKQGLTSMPGFEIRNKAAERYIVYSMQATTSNQPCIEIGFIDSDGLKDYWTYNSYNAGPAGTAYVSDYTQKLTVVREDINFSTDLQTLAVSFAFSNDRTQSTSPNIGYGNGWNTSYNLRLLYDNFDASYYTLDYTGNRVYYFEQTCDSRWVSDDDNDYVCHIAEDGSGNLLIRHLVVSLSFLDTYIITPQNTKLQFTNNYLSQVLDLDTGLIITISRNQTTRNKITKIVDSTGNEVVFTYIGNGNLASLELKTKGNASAMHSLEKVYFEYFPGTNYLHKVYYLTDYDQNPDLTLNLNDLSNVDRIVRYDHNISGLLATAYTRYLGSELNSQGVPHDVDRLGEDLRFFYYSLDNRSISKVESYFNDTKVAEVNYDLQPNQTKVTDHSGNFVLYSFDRYGHTVNILDKQGNAQYFAYRDIFVVGSQQYRNYLLNHKVIYESSPAKQTFSPIQNPGFENGLVGWVKFNCVSYSDCLLSTVNKTIGSSSLQVKSSTPAFTGVTQSITLKKGVYNLSVDVRTLAATSGEVEVVVGDRYTTVEPNQDWVKVYLTIPILNDNTLTTIQLLSSSTSYVYFDNLQWYEDNQKERTNLIDNPSFELGETYNWSIYPGTGVTLHTINNGSGAYDSLYQSVLGNTAIGLKNGKISTTIPMNQITGTGFGTIFLSGWANRYTAPSINNANTGNFKSFKMFVTQLDSSDQVILSGAKNLNFNLSYSNWQYLYEEIKLEPNATKIQIDLMYYGEGEVLFDGISMFFKEDKRTYNYYPDGRIDFVQYPNNKKLVYEYEGESIFPNIIHEKDSNDVIIQSVSVTNNGSQVTGVIKNNVKIGPSYNPSGQMTSYSAKTANDDFTYFSSSTTYTHLSQYKSTITNEFGNTTTFYTDVITGLHTHITNSKNATTQFEYYDNGALRTVKILNSVTNEESSVVYVYNVMNQLVEIQLAESQYSYKIEYDLLGRMEHVKVNTQTLMSYQYLDDQNGYPTSQIETQTYGNGDSIQFVYTADSKLVSEVQFLSSGTSSYITRFEYEYDSNDRMIKYTDVTRNVIEYYEYDYQGRITKISLSSGGTTDYINFSYDEDEGYLTELSTSISNTTLISKYFHDESLLYPGLYDKTEYTFSSSNALTVDWQYNTGTGMDPLARLQKLQYSYQGQQNDSISINFVYQDYTSRINKITVDAPSATALKKIQYEYTYDNLGNIIEEKYREMAQGSSVFVDIITRKYIYDDLNQLIQESVHNTQVDCNNTANIHACYLKIYEYDKLGNLIRQKTLKYLNTTSLVKVSALSSYSNGEMGFKYNGSNQYYTPYAIPVGGSINLTFSFYDYTDFPPELITSPVSVTLNSSNVNTNSPGIYLLTGTAYASGYGYYLEFGIIVNVGNVVVVNQVNYSYNTAWKDQLSSYTVVSNGISKTSVITYDDPDDLTKSQGNPTRITNFNYEGIKYDHANLKWEGRQLVNIKVYSSSNDTVKDKELWYSYNDQGIRVSKIIDTTGNNIPNIKYEYVVVGDQVLAEIVSSWNSNFYRWDEIYQINYLYENDGSAIGFQYFTPSTSPSTYLYIRNIQGDVTKIVDQNGNILVRYEYDAYGNILSMTGSHANTLGKHNSLTYRSYKYDREINLYYLNSRYYNPDIGRFISSDGLLGPVGNILGHNMYAYTQNNPVMYTDITGYAREHWYIAGGVVLLLAIATIITCGGVGVAITAIGLAAQGVAYVGLSTGATILAFTTAGTAGALVSAGIYAGLTSQNTSEFDNMGLMALASTFLGGVFGAYFGLVSTRQNFYRAMSTAEVQAVKETSYLRGGRDGQTFFTDTPYFSSNSAQSQLSLSTSPDYMMRFKIINNPHVFGPQSVSPMYGMNGGGNEYYSFDAVKVTIKSIWRLY